MRSSSLKLWLHISGGVFGLIGVAFVVLQLNTYAEQIELIRFDTNTWSLFGLLALVYGAANLLLAQAWWHLLDFFDVKVQRRWAVKAYGLSQIAKYVPGNIFQMAGRQALGMCKGLPARALAKSALWELGLIAIGGAFFCVLVAPLVWRAITVFLSVVLFAALLLVAVIALRVMLSPSVSVALIYQLVFLVITGVVFIGVLSLVSPSIVTFPIFFTLCGGYVIAWLAGLVTPGAPAGIGVRELVLLFLFHGVLLESDLVMAVVIGRMVTAVGDTVFWLAALILLKRD